MKQAAQKESTWAVGKDRQFPTTSAVPVLNLPVWNGLFMACWLHLSLWNPKKWPAVIEPWQLKDQLLDSGCRNLKPRPRCCTKSRELENQLSLPLSCSMSLVLLMSASHHCERTPIVWTCRMSKYNTALPWTLSNTHAKCEADKIKDCQNMWATYILTDRTLWNH